MSSSSNNNGEDEDLPPLSLQEMGYAEERNRQKMRIAQGIVTVMVILLFMSILDIKMSSLLTIVGILILLSVTLRIIFCLCIRFHDLTRVGSENSADIELETGRRSSSRRHRSHRSHRHHRSREGNNNDNNNDGNEDIQVINPLSLRLSLVDRDFTEEDYEVLLALDRMAQLIDNAIGTLPQRGATESELNELPTHVYKSVIAENNDKNEVEKSEDKVKELDAERNVCAICLENFVDGDVVTTTPCFHQFHKGCIDTWLVQKAVCPICKYELFRPQSVDN